MFCSEISCRHCLKLGHGWKWMEIPWSKSNPLHMKSSGKQPHNYGKSQILMGKSTISTGPFSSSQTVSLPGRVSFTQIIVFHI
jgi:hypothetical protein